MAAHAPFVNWLTKSKLARLPQMLPALIWLCLHPSDRAHSNFDSWFSYPRALADYILRMSLPCSN
jgi:hypothetical protein